MTGFDGSVFFCEEKSSLFSHTMHINSYIITVICFTICSHRPGNECQAKRVIRP